MKKEWLGAAKERRRQQLGMTIGVQEDVDLFSWGGAQTGLAGVCAGCVSGGTEEGVEESECSDEEGADDGLIELGVRGRG